MEALKMDQPRLLAYAEVKPKVEPVDWGIANHKITKCVEAVIRGPVHNQLTQDLVRMMVMEPS